MPAYKVGDTVIHWVYGSGKIVEIADKGLPGKPCFYYIIKGNRQTIWVEVDEASGSSLHAPISQTDFRKLINILRSPGEKMSENPTQRSGHIDERMQKASPEDLCRFIRDLTHRARRRKLGSLDIRALKHAEAFLLDEWERSWGTTRDQARGELEWILRDTL